MLRGDCVLKVRCSSDKPMSCIHRFNSAICSNCKNNEYMCEYTDASIYDINVFSVKKSVFSSEMDKVGFLTDFIGVLSLKYKGIEVVEYSFKEDSYNSDYFELKVISK